MNDQELTAFNKAKELNDKHGLNIEDKDIEELVIRVSTPTDIPPGAVSRAIKSVLRQFATKDRKSVV